MAYLARRLLEVVPVLLGVTVLVFVLVRAIPGDPALNLAGERATPAMLERIRAKHGLDQPLAVQYVRFLGNLGRGDLGDSIVTGRPVTAEIARTFPATCELALTAMVLATVLGVTIGVLASLKPGSWVDLSSMGGALVGVSVPVFCLGYVLIVAFGSALPFTGRLSEDVRQSFQPETSWYLLEALVRGQGGAALDVLRHLCLPAVALCTVPLAVVARITRSTMVEVLSQDYVRTARAKGLPYRQTVVRHALRNAMIPVLTIVGVQTGYLLGGAVLTETVFAYPGLGRFIVDSIGQRDYPVIQGGVLLFATTFVFVNLLVDVLYARLDPRVRLDG